MKKKLLSCGLSIALLCNTVTVFAQNNVTTKPEIRQEKSTEIQPRVDIDMGKVFNDWKNLPGIPGGGYNAYWQYNASENKINTTANVGFTGFYNPDLMKFTTGTLEYQMQNNDGDTGGFIWGLQKSQKQGKDVYSFYIYEECGAHNKWTIARIDEWIPADNNKEHVGPLFHGKLDYDWNKNGTSSVYDNHQLDPSTVGASANYSKGVKLAEGDLPEGSRYPQKHKVSIEIKENSTKISLNDKQLEEVSIPVKPGSFGPVSCSNPSVSFFDFKMEAAPDNTALTTQFDYKVNGNVVQNDNTIVDFGSKFEIDDKSQIDTPATIVGKEWIVKKDGTEIYRGSTPYTGYANEEGTYETTLINTGSNGLTGTVTKTIRVAKKPTINIPDSIVIEGKDKYNKDDLKNGVTATDKTGKDISGNIVIDDSKITAADGEPGKYDVTYKVTDEYGVTTEKTVEVTVIERIPGLDIKKAPKINIPGNIVIQGGDKYNKDDLKNGITATDKEGNDISGNIVIDDSKIDKEHSGTYNVIYTVKDKDGITTKVEVPVKVEVKVPGLDIKKAPKFNVSGNLNIIEGDKYDPKDAIKDNKVTATDGKGNDISNKIEVVKNNVKPDVPGKYDVIYKVTDADGISKEITVKITVEEKIYADNDNNNNNNNNNNDNNTENNVDTDKIQGNNRIETAVEASKKLYPSGTPVVVLANAERYTDVLTANPFAIQENGAALLTYKYDIPKKTMEEIERLGARKIYISGGYDAVSKKVVTELENKGYDIFRFDGVNRYDTARKIAIKIREKGNKNMAELASGEDFPDALCMAPLAVKDKAPILLAKKDSIPYHTKQALAEWDIENIKIAGLDKAISNNVEKSLEKGFKLTNDSKKDSEVYTGAKSIKRIGGYDRYETSSAIAKEAYPNAKLGVYATGEDFPDALIAGNYAGRRESAVLLVKKDVLPESIEKHTKASSFNKITVIGGKDAISEKVINSIKKAIK